MTTPVPSVDLRPDHWRIVRDALLHHVPDREVIAFGSRATWTAKDYSDLDLAIMGEEPLSLRTCSALDEALGDSDLPFKVDVVDWARIDDGFRRIIRRHGVAIQAPDVRANAGASVVQKPGTLGLYSGCRRWARKPLGHVIELKRGYDLPARKRVAGSVPVVSSSGITGNHWETKIRGPGVVTGRYGTLGKVYFIPDDFWLLNTTLYVRDFKGNDPRFVSYFLCGIDFSGHSDKAAVPGLNRNHMHEEVVNIPTDISEQRAIAHILGTLDDKIELYKQMNKTLEAMAQALFKSWFIDFDPVRAKMEGRDTDLPGHLDDLFPDRLVDSEMGLIPEEWMPSSLEDHARLSREGVAPSGLPRDYPYIGLEHMPRRSVALTNWGSAGSIKSRKSSFLVGDILFGKLRPYFHKVGIAPVDGICSTDILVLRPKRSHWSAYILACVSSLDFVAFTDQTSTGTKMPRTSWKSMGTYKMCQPTDEIVRAFQAALSPMLGRIIENVHQSRVLAALRDTLLPRLVSGEIRVPITQESQQRIS